MWAYRTQSAQPSNKAAKPWLSVREMVFDVHDRVFRFFHGACQRGIYGDMNMAVEVMFIG